MRKFNDPIESAVRSFSDGLRDGNGGKPFTVWSWVKATVCIAIIAAVAADLWKRLSG